MPDLKARLEALAEKATKGRLIAHGWGDGSTQMGMTNIFNEDAEVLLMECIPEDDAALIAELVNALPELLAALSAAERVREDEREAICRMIQKRMDVRFQEHGSREWDTNATYYEGRASEIFEAEDEEDEAVIAAIRARAILDKQEQQP